MHRKEVKVLSWGLGPDGQTAFMELSNGTWVQIPGALIEAITVQAAPVAPGPKYSRDDGTGCLDKRELIRGAFGNEAAVDALFEVFQQKDDS